MLEKKAGLKQESFAKLIGLSRVSIVNIEKGRQYPPLHLLWNISRTLNIELDHIIPNQLNERRSASNDFSRFVDEKISDSLEGFKASEDSFNKLKCFLMEQMDYSLETV